jgi:chromate reductase
VSSINIAVLVGSLRKDSLNRKLAIALQKLAHPELSFAHIDIASLPHYDQDDDPSPPAVVSHFRQAIASTQGLLFVTAEYNRSIPGVLKNAIDQGSRPYGKSVWVGKPAGVIGGSVGAIGTALAQQHLRNVLAYLDVPTLGQPEAFIQAKEGLFDATGGVGTDSRAFLQTWMDRYSAWVKLHARA